MVIDWLEIDKVAVEDEVQVDPSQDKGQDQEYGSTGCGVFKRGVQN